LGYGLDGGDGDGGVFWAPHASDAIGSSASERVVSLKSWCELLFGFEVARNVLTAHEVNVTPIATFEMCGFMLEGSDRKSTSLSLDKQALLEIQSERKFVDL
tara:strand:+ start:53 stop:358 length:306 start_codon:yes stop_codon:yes gene_type:complete